MNVPKHFAILTSVFDYVQRKSASAINVNLLHVITSNSLKENSDRESSKRASRNFKHHCETLRNNKRSHNNTQKLKLRTCTATHDRTLLPLANRKLKK